MNFKAFLGHIYSFVPFSRQVSVLAYHSVSDGTTPISLPTSEFEQQMEYFHSHGFHVISLADYIEIKEGHKKAQKKSVLITFDDAYKDVYENALPILKKYNFPAVMSVNPSYFGKKAEFATLDADKARNICTEEEVKGLARGGVAIVNHGFSHKDFTTLSEEKIRFEYEEAKNWIEKNIEKNKRGDVLVFPKGSKDNRSISVLKKLGARIIFNQRVNVYPHNSLSYFVLSLRPSFQWMRDNQSFIKTVLVLVGLKIILGILLLHNIPNVGLPANHYLSSGGDDASFVRDANSILKGQWFSFLDDVGYPLFIAGVILLTGFTSFPDIATPLVFANVFVFSTLAMIFSICIVWHFWKNVKYVIFAGVSFMAIPYIWFAIFRNFVLVQIKDPSIIDPFGWAKSMHLFGLMSLNDWFSFAITSLALLLFLKGRYTWSGLLFGLSFLVRVQNMFPLFFLAVVLLLSKKFKNFFQFGIAAFVTGCFQLVQNYVLTSSIFEFAAYSSKYNVNTAEHPVGFQNVLESFPRLTHYVPFAIPVLLVGLIVAYMALKYFVSKKELLYFLIATGVLSPFMLLFSNPAIRNPRYFLPFTPLFIVFLIAAYEVFFLRKKSYNPE